jgi:hypothetical protein
LLITVNQKVEEVASTISEAYDVVLELLSSEEEVVKGGGVAFKSASSPAEVDGNLFLEKLSKPKIINGKLYHPSKSDNQKNREGNAKGNEDSGSGQGNGGNNFELSGKPNPNGAQVLTRMKISMQDAWLSFVFKAKVASKGCLDKLKAHCVACGDLQEKSNPDDMWAPCVFACTFKVFVSEASC